MSTKQNHFIVGLMKSLHCYDPASLQLKLVPLTIRLTTKEALDESAEGFPYHLHGSLILQELLNFNKPIKVVNSLLALDSGSLKNILTDPKGSHISDAFMSSSTVGEKSRTAIVKSLHVSSKYGK